MTKKQIIINQLITDVAGMNDIGQEKEIELILNKINLLKKIEDKKANKANKETKLVDEVEASGFEYLCNINPIMAQK